MAEDNLDEKVLMGLGLGDLSPEEKQVMLNLLDDRLEKRFVANLLMGLPDDKRAELEKQVEAMPEPELGKVLEAAIKVHPDAEGVLKKSAQEIIDEFKAVQAGAAGGTPPNDTPQEPASPEQNTSTPEAADEVAEKPAESVVSATNPSELEQSMASQPPVNEPVSQPTQEPAGTPASNELETKIEPAPEAPMAEPEKPIDEGEKDISVASPGVSQPSPTPDYYQPTQTPSAPTPTDKPAEQDSPVAPPPAPEDNTAEPSAGGQNDKAPALPTPPPSV